MNTLTQNAENIIFDTPQFTQKAVSVALDKIAATCADYADIYVQSGFYEQWHLEESIVKSGSFSARRGFGVRAVTGSQTAFAYADNPEDKALDNATAAVVSVTHGQSQQSHGKVSGSLNGSIYTADNPVTAMNAADKVALLQKIDNLTRAADSRVKEVNASIVSAMEFVWLKRLDGRTHGDIRPLLRLS
ncbi:MAG: metalloprotease TldD, partial [Neisseriaceae bacterium]|nr:metalloprotease TldD [Neisseriaceae bacterium]